MARAELGTKHQCSECGTKFYDLCRANAICPKCETDMTVVAKPKPQPAPEQKPDGTQTPVVEEDDSIEEVAGAEDVGLEIVGLEEAVEEEEDEAAAVKDLGIDDDGDNGEDGEQDKDVFLETDDEDEPSVSEIIGGGIAKGADAE